MNYQTAVSNVVTWISDVKTELANKYPNQKRLNYLINNRPSDEELNKLGAEPEIRHEYQKVLRQIAMK